VLVVVLIVLGVSVTGMQIVDVPVVLDGLVAAVFAVRVVMRGGHNVNFVELALVVVSVVLPVSMSVVQIVGVAGMLDHGMAAVGRMRVPMYLVGCMLGGHALLLAA